MTLNILAHYHMMKTTIVKHLLYSFTLFLRVFKTHSMHSLIFNYIEYFILIYIVTYLTLCKYHTCLRQYFSLKEALFGYAVVCFSILKRYSIRYKVHISNLKYSIFNFSDFTIDQFNVEWMKYVNILFNQAHE